MGKFLLIFRYVVATCSIYPAPTTCISWGGFYKDNRGLNTELYQLATCGEKIISLWTLDSYKGVLEKEVISTGNFVREYISLCFSLDNEKYLYAGTTSGDIVCILVKNKMIVFNKIVCAQGVTSICAISKDQLIVGGGDGSLVLLYIDEPKCSELAKINLHSSIFSVSCSFDGVQLLTSTVKGFIYRVRVLDLSHILLNENHTNSINTFFSLNDREYRFGTGSLDGTIRLWNTNDYSVYTRIFINPGVKPTSLVFTEDLVVSGWTDSKIRCHRADNAESN